MDGYLSKPFKLDQLQNAIHAVLPRTATGDDGQGDHDSLENGNKTEEHNQGRVVLDR